MSEWEKLRIDIIEMLQRTNWDDPSARAYCADELGHVSYVVYRGDISMRQTIAPDVAADSGSVNPDSGDPSNGRD